MTDVSDPRTLRELLTVRAAEFPDAIAIATPGRLALTYAALADQSARVFSELTERGIGVGDPVALVLPNGPEMASAFLTVAGAASAAPLNPGYRAEDFAFFLEDLGARAVLVAADTDSPVRDVASTMGVSLLELVSDENTAGLFGLRGDEAGPVAELSFASAEDVALVLHTSGTTSRPKQVPLRHSNLVASAQNIAHTLELSPGDRCLNVMPLFHIHGLMAALLASVSAGASVVCTPGFDTNQFFPWLSEFSPTWYTAVPTMHQAILGSSAGHADEVAGVDLRFVRSSSASLPPAVMTELESLFRAPVIEAYGMTEAAHQMASNPLPPGRRKPGTVGPAAGPEVAIIDQVGELVASGERGEIAIRGKNVTSGYVANPEANASAFVNGWFRTGDEGVMDSDGFVTITGRLKEMINRGGEKVTPREIDEVLLGHRDVSQAVAFAIPHPSLGEDVGAAVVLIDGAETTEAELRRYCFAELADFKVPSRVVSVGAIPKGPTGKLQRIGLAEKLTSALEVAHEPAEGALESLIVSIWQPILGLDGVGRLDNFFSLGGDSLKATAAIAQLVNLAGVALEPSDLFLAPTPAELAERIQAATDVDGPALARLVPLRAGNGDAPIYCVPAHGGDVFTFLEMARELASGRPIVAVEFSSEIRTDDAYADAQGREVAAEVCELVRARQPEGPYHFVAVCYGVDVIQWTIQSLEQDGERVDTAVFIHAHQENGMREIARPLWQRFISRSLRPLPSAVRTRLGLSVRPPKSPRLAAPVTTVRLIDEMHDGVIWDPHMGWARYADVASGHDLPGDRFTVFQAPVATKLARIVDEAVSSAN